MMFFKKERQPSDEQIQALTRLFAEGRLDDLIEQAGELTKQFPRAAQPHNILAVAYNALGDYCAAADSAEQAIRLQSDFAKAYVNLGTALAGLGDDDKALESYRQAVLLQPDFAEGYNNLGVFLISLDRYEEAAEALSTAVQLKPDYFRAYNNLGCAQAELGQSEAAIASFEQAIALQPDFAEAYNNLGGAQADAGQPQEAVASFEQAIQLKPDYAEAYRQLAELTNFEPDSPFLARMREMEAGSDLTDKQRMHLSFALAGAEDDLGHADAAFGYFEQGNALRCQLHAYNIEDDRDLFHRIKTAFSAPVPEANVERPEASTIPIFILGMPRSGTTLIEQILASHSMVRGMGEVPTLDRAVSGIRWDENGIEKQQVEALRGYYLDWLRQQDIEERFATDKSPLNFRWIGFILRSMPEARIIHIRRDAPATCWSIYKHYFSTDAHGYGYHPETLAAFYRLYDDIMDFWEQRFPGRIHHVRYETLTENQREETKKLLGYCGLEWEESCMDFHLSDRNVITASRQQVRRKMYQGSSDAWRKYEKHLQPLLRALEGL